LLALLATAIPHAQAQSPHIGNRTYSLEQVMRVQSALDASNGAPNIHSGVVFNQGYVVQVYSREGSNPQAGIAVYDLSDPTRPRLFSHTEAPGLTEQHAIAFSRQEGRTYTAHLTVDGIAIWDWTAMDSPRQISRLKLPGIMPGYTHGAWWLAWQAPTLYVSGAANGIYIVDTSDITRPQLADRKGEPNPLPNNQTGGFRVGSLFAVGNLLVASANDGLGYATLDISDPLNPSLLTARIDDAPASYSSMLNGNHLYAAGKDNELHVFDISDPHQLRYTGSAALEGRGGYLTIQDGFAHVGASNHYMKVDISTDGEYKPLGSATSNNSGGDEDFAVALGNLVIISDDHDNGSYIVPHQSDADTTGPSVNMVIPADGATNRSRATRIGLTFTDLVDLRSVDSESIVIRPLDGEPLEGIFSAQSGIINFAPHNPLEANTTYEVIVPAGGVIDVMGNPTPVTFRSTFSTGDTLGQSLWCALNAPAAVATGEALSLKLHAAAPNDSIVRWDYGDSSPIVDSPLTPTGTHTYNAAGRYSVRVTVDWEDGATACSTRVTIFDPPTPARPQNSSTILLDSSGTQVWNVNPDNDSVSVIDAVRLQKMGEVAVGRQPRTLAQAPDGTIWTANQVDATLTVIDAGTQANLATLPLPRGSEPYGIVFSPANASAYVSLQSTGQIAEIDAGSRRVLRYLDVGPTPRALAISADGQRLFVTRFVSASEQGTVVEIDLTAWQVRRRIPLAYDPGPDTEASGRGVPNGLAALAISPSGEALWVAGRKSNTARGLQRDGERLAFESTVRSMLATIDLAAGQEELALRYDFNDRDGPVALRFSPLGDTLFVALEGANAVEVLDAYTHQLVTSIDNTGHAPQGLVFTADGGKLFIHSWLTRSVYAYDVSKLFSTDAGVPALLAEINTVANDRTPPQVLLGKQIFYNAADPRMSRDGYLACASCHFDSRDDGQVWDRTAEGEGLRNTISLLGKGSPGHGALHWSANFDEVQDFENDMRANFGGQGFMADELFYSAAYSRTLGDTKASHSAELDALAAYIDSLRQLPPSPFRDPDGTLTEDGEAGRIIFISAGCASCHGGPQFTDSPTGLRHQIGTITHASGQRLGAPLRGLDTPTLRGLWLTAPYLHDGSAPDLASLFTTRNPLGLYASLQSFLESNPRAIEQLVAYLLQIDDSEPSFDPPSLAIDIVAPADHSRIRLGEEMLLQVNISATMGPAANVEYYANDQLIGVTYGPLYSMKWRPGSPGEVEITARLLYASGAATIGTPRHVAVTP
jgi:YVTN family beta-propeller protein